MNRCILANLSVISDDFSELDYWDRQICLLYLKFVMTQFSICGLCTTVCSRISIMLIVIFLSHFIARPQSYIDNRQTNRSTPIPGFGCVFR